MWLFSIYFFRGQKRILAEEVEDLINYFRSYEGSKNYVDIVGFRKLIGAKNDYYSGRIFKLVDQNNDNQVCIDEYTEFMTKLSPDDQNGMIEFLFKILIQTVRTATNNHFGTLTVLHCKKPFIRDLHMDEKILIVFTKYLPFLVLS